MIAACTALAVVPAIAPATPSGNVAFVRDGDLWRVSPDDRSTQQVTRNGTPAAPYRSPAQADNGVLVAIRGEILHRYALDGRAMTPLALPPAPEGHAQRPVDVDISPDGARVAVVTEDACTPADPASPRCRDVVVLATGSGRLASRPIVDAPDVTGLAWAGSDRLLVTRGNTLLSLSASHPHIPPAVWVADDGSGATLEIPTAGMRGVTVQRRAPSGELSVRMFTSPTATSAPTVRCDISGAGIAHPALATREGAVAWQTDLGVVVADVPVTGCPSRASLVALGGTQPDWSPAALSPTPVLRGSATIPSGSTAGAQSSAATQIAVITAGPGLRLSMRLHVSGRVTVIVDRRVRGVVTRVRTLRSVKRKGRVQFPLGLLPAGTYRVRVSIALAGTGRVAVPPLRLVVRRG